MSHVGLRIILKNQLVHLKNDYRSSKKGLSSFIRSAFFSLKSYVHSVHGVCFNISLTYLLNAN